MFPNYCRCCFNKTDILMSIRSKSSHMDDKILLDYFNSVFGAFVEECDKLSEFICLRCSKALQVSYHFISMVKDSKESRKYLPSNNNEAIILDSSSVNEKENSSLSLKNNINNNLNLESSLERRTNESDMPLNEIVPLKLTNSFKTFLQDSNTDAGSSLQAKKYNLDFECIICNKFFEDRQEFFEHNRQKHKEIVPFKCKLCGYYTCYTESLLKHCEKIHGLNNIALDLYQTKEVVKKADGDSPDFEITFLCTQCKFQCDSQTSIDQHLSESHTISENQHSVVKKIFNCPSCYRSFMTLKSAKIHYSMYHICSFKNSNTGNKRKFDCEKCGKKFGLKSGLFLHRLICESREAVNCNFCELQFTSVLKYECHLQEKHWVAIKHECEICCKTFSCPEYLTVHRKRHNERYYQCDLCSKNYISNAELKVHKQRIHAIKHVAMSCAVCGKEFAHLGLLRKHENSEHNKRFYKCAYCDFESPSSSNIKIHQYNHTGKPYKCRKCPKEFAFRKIFRQHCEKQHSITLTNEEIAKMFKQSHGYTSRFDAFSKQNNSLEITGLKKSWCFF